MTGAQRDGLSVSRTVGAWFEQIEPRPPAALESRLAALLAPHASEPWDTAPEACLGVAEGLLGCLLASGSTSRGTALDLLTVDALVTYAFQAAADRPERIEGRAVQAMSAIAALSGERSA